MNMFAGKRNSLMIYNYTHAIHIHSSQLASSLSSSTVCGVVGLLECGYEYYGSSVDAAGGRGSVEKINSR